MGKKIHLTGDSDHQGVAIIKIFFFKKKKNLKFFSTIFFKKNNVYIRFYTCRTVRESWSEKRCDFFKKVSVFSVSVSPPVGERCEKKWISRLSLSEFVFALFFIKSRVGCTKKKKTLFLFFQVVKTQTRSLPQKKSGPQTVIRYRFVFFKKTNVINH